MKKVTIVCLAAEKQTAIQTMQKLGTLHVTPVKQPQSTELDELRRRQALLNRAVSALSSRKPAASSKSKEALQAQKALEDTIEKLDALDKLKESRIQTRKDLALLAPWGSFDSKSIDNLRAAGIHVAFCAAPAASIPTLKLPADSIVKTISGDKK